MFGEDVFIEYEEIVTVHTTNKELEKEGSALFRRMTERFLIFWHSVFYYKRTHRL